MAGPATIVATRDEEMRPGSEPGLGLAVGQDGEQLSLCVEVPAVREQVAVFSAEVAQLGLPADAGEALMVDELPAVTVEPCEVFDQTPGPTAGSRL